MPEPDGYREIGRVEHQWGSLEGAGGIDFTPLFECDRCACVVADTEAHDSWHDSFEAFVAEAVG